MSFNYYIYNNSSENFTNGKKYKRCNHKKVSGLLNNIFNTNNITKTENDNWDLYIPCGYNLVEQELKQLIPQNSNQLVFGISGCDRIVSKNGIWFLLQNKYGREIAKNIMPETFILSSKNDMDLFRKKFNKNKKYILKKNIQRKKGLKISHNYNEIINSKNEGYKIVQEYKNDTFLIDETKMNLRVYVLLICQFGKIDTYIHRQGKCLYASKKYIDNNTDFDSLITDSYKLKEDSYDNKPESFEELKKYLINRKYNSNLLFKKIDVLIQKISLASENHLCQLDKLKNNKTFQLFGVDIIFDNNMNPMLLEFNKGPDMIPKNKKDANMKSKIELDMLQKVGLVEIKKLDYVNEFYLV